jgi:hypothetical protein
MKTTPKDFFLQVAAFAALYVSAVSLINLLFSAINVVFPDALNNYSYYSYDPYTTGLRLAIASLVIVFPLFLVLTRFINSDIAKEPAKADLWPRRWLTYLTLFVAGLAVSIDLIVLVNTFLSGEITTRFVLKVLALLAVTGMAFAYYFMDLKQGTSMPAKTRMGWRIGAVALVVVSLVWGFSVLGSPAKARDLRFDAQKVNDLQNIQWQVISFWQQKEKLPASLAELEDPISSNPIPVDAESGNGYEYRVTGALSFELCAEFNRPTDERAIASDKMMASSIYPYEGANANWKHDAGRTCFERTVDPERYPPVVKAKN